MVFEPPPNNSFKPRPLRGSAQMVAFTITPSRAAARLNSGVSWGQKWVHETEFTGEIP